MSMEFKVGSKVFYPSHGAGVIKDKKEIEFDGQKRTYFEFELITNSLTISTPVENIESLGVRPVLSPEEIKKAIKVLKKNPSVDPKVKDFNVMLALFKDLENSADINDSVKIIQYCNFIKKNRKNEGRLIPVSIDNQLESAIKNIVGELAVSTDTDLQTAMKKFTKITGIKYSIEKD